MPTTLRVRLEVEEVPGGVIDSRLVSAAFDEGGRMNRYEVATAVTDQAMPISTTTGVATIQAVYLLSDQTISLRQVAADTALTVNANRPFLLMGTSITALLVSNSSGSTASILLVVYGT